MRRNLKRVLWSASRTALAGTLAASTVVFAQNTTEPAPSNGVYANAPAEANPSGGWKRVGENAEVQVPNASYGAQDYNQNQPNYPDQQQPNYPANAPQQNAPQSQGQGYGQQGYPAYNGQMQGYGQQQQQQGYQQPPPIPAQLSLQAGSYVTVRVNQMLSSDKNQPGDAFTASLVQPLVVNGVVVAEPGQTLGGRVVSAEKHHVDKPARLGIQLTNMTLVDGQQIPLATQFVSRAGGTTSRGTEVGTVAATTGVGATIGAIAGWGTGAAIGAGAGAAAGLIGVLVTHNHAIVIYPEQILTFRIEAPVTISTERSANAFRYVQPNEYDRPTYANYAGGSYYESAAPQVPVYNTYAYGYPYYPYYGGWGWGGYYPYWGIGFGFYGGYWGGYPYYWGGRYYGGRGYYGYGRGYYGGRGYVGGGYVGGGARGYVGGGSRGSVGGGHR